MKLAIVPAGSLKYLREFCSEMEEEIKLYKDSDDEGEDRERLIKKVIECDTIFHHIEHVVLAYETIFKHACDQDLKHIEFNPEIKAFLDSKEKPKTEYSSPEREELIKKVIARHPNVNPDYLVQLNDTYIKQYYLGENQF